MKEGISQKEFDYTFKFTQTLVGHKSYQLGEKTHNTLCLVHQTVKYASFK